MTDTSGADKTYIPLGLLTGGTALLLIIIGIFGHWSWPLWIGVALTGFSLHNLTQDIKRLRDAIPETPVHLPANIDEDSGFQEALSALPDPVLIVSGFEPHDIAGRWVVFANQAARSLFGIAGDNSLLVSSMRNPQLLDAVDIALFDRQARHTSFETSGAQDQFWMAWTAPLPNPSGAKKLALVVIHDETDTRRIERMRADFLANASHELRTPLASVSGFIETLRGPAKDDPAARDKFLGIMAAQADRMGRLINDLLSLSRIEMNEHVPPAGEADLSSAVNDVMDSLSVLAREKNVTLRVTGPSAGLYRINADRDQIIQVVQNLSDNALKYSPAGSEVRIDIRVNQTKEQASATRETGAARLVLLKPDRTPQSSEVYTVIRVRDSGPGIRREFLPRLAERFYRVEGQKSGDRLGTGLGLAIVKHIINRHRGGLVVESVSCQSGDNKAMLGVLPDAPRSDNVTPLPTVHLNTFTAFTAYFPQPRLFDAAPAPQSATGGH
ncbi:MAG: ATP-binding protein [Asticcacaulis sp.]